MQTRPVTREQAEAAFFQALNKGGVGPLLRTASELFHAPVLLTDENYRLLACYPFKKIGQPIWDELYEQGTLGQDVIWTYQNAYLQDQSRIYTPFFSDQGLAKEHPRIFGEVYTDTQQILGHIAIFLFDQPCCRNDLELTQIFLDALRIRMLRSAELFPDSRGDLLDLLSPETPDQRRAAACQALTRRIRGAFCLAVTPVGDSAAQRAFWTTAVRHISTACRNAACALYDNNIVTLFGEMSGAPCFTRREREFLTSGLAVLHRAYPCTGVSLPFGNLEDLNRGYHQALLTARLGKPQLTFYGDAAPAQFFLPVLTGGTAPALLHPALEKLRAYDRENGTQYFETLMAYSLELHDREETARVLCIHRNTLLYRLNRIRALFDLSVEDKRTARHLLNSFQLWTLMNGLPEEMPPDREKPPEDPA